MQVIFYDSCTPYLVSNDDLGLPLHSVICSAAQAEAFMLRMSGWTSKATDICSGIWQRGPPVPINS